MVGETFSWKFLHYRKVQNVNMGLLTLVTLIISWKGLLCALTHAQTFKKSLFVSTLASDLQECSRNLTELIETLQRLHNRWEEYKSFLEGPAQYNTLLTTQQLGRGRPQFQVSKSQVEYLASLSFKWTEIASILGLSRMTLYRYDM